MYQTLDPVRVLKQIRVLQDGLWRHAVQALPAEASFTPPVFDLQACLPTGRFTETNGALSPELMEILGTTPEHQQKQKYHRKTKVSKPRTYRTRKDPFEEVKDELHQWFLDAPDSTGKMLLQKLQYHYPDRYPDGLLRTLQRRLRGWRQEVILAYDDHLIRKDAGLTQPTAPQILAMPISNLRDEASVEM